jgi:methylenetetrahydrofolate dehydrogenase (NADP+)/methenyltetrahydrofolate cyclohydrolase
MEILSGTKTSEARAEIIKSDVKSLGFSPVLVIIRVGERADSKSYVNRKTAYAEKVGITAQVVHFPESVSESELLESLQNYNRDTNVNGIIVQLPLPNHLNEKVIIETINPSKDVDGLTDANISKLFDNQSGVIPATPRGVLTLLQTHGIEIEGQHVVVIGRSRLVGKSAALLMLNQNATVTICHSKTKNLRDITKSADILIVAIGKQKFITKEFVREGQVIIDVGIGSDDNKIVGDVDFQSVKDMDIKISPVPGGVGPMTVASLFENLIMVTKQQLR